MITIFKALLIYSFSIIFLGCVLQAESNDNCNADNSCEPAKNQGLYIWKIEGEEITNLVNTDLGKMYDFQMFEIANFDWIWGMYPYGEDETGKKWPISYLYLLKLPQQFKSVFVESTIHTIGHVSFSTLMNFTKDNDVFKVYMNYPLISKLQELQLNEFEMTLELSLRVIQIVANNNTILFHDVRQIETQQTIQWSIDEKFIEQFENVPAGVRMESKRYQNDLFRIICSPKGVNAEKAGNMSLHLQLVDIPTPLVTDIKVNLTMSLLSPGYDDDMLMNKTGVVTYNLNDTLWGWNVFYISKYLVLLSVLSDQDLQFIANVEILNIYDANGVEIEKSEWNDVDIVYNYDQCFSDNRDDTIETKSSPADNERDEEASSSVVDNTDSTHNVQTEQQEAEIVSDNEEIGEVKMWLKTELNLSQYVDKFINNGYDDMNTIVETMNEDDLEEIGIKLKGHRKKIMLNIKKKTIERKINRNHNKKYLPPSK